jgi:hypothetical protein
LASSRNCERRPAERRSFLPRAFSIARLAAVFSALSFGVAACGGSDSSKSATPTTRASGATGPTAVEPPARQQSRPGADRNAGKKARSKRTGPGQTGGSSAGSAVTGQSGPAPASGKQGSSPKKAPSKSPRRLEDLTAAQQRKLQADLYNQGVTLCFSYGPERLAHDYQFPTTDPQEVARRFANLYEKANPTLALPYQQGCLAGFRKRAKAQAKG